jgi:anaerobic magnesium-protoporphyrin IX monomethyl ester cyclase
MARVALIKLFTGLNLGVSQLSGQLRRAGHDTRIIYFKDFVVLPADDTEGYLVTDYALTNVAARGREYVWNCYTPFSEREYALLFAELARFQPQLIGLSLTSLTMKPAAGVTAQLKLRFPDVPIIWGGAGPTLEPDWALQHADLVCKGEGEELIVELAERLDAGADYADLHDLWLRRDGEIVRNPSRPLPDIESIAMPDFERSRTIHINNDVIAYDVYPLVLGTQYPIMTQRGCPFSCNFCIESVYQDMFGKKGSLRRRSVDVVIEELVRVKRTLGVRSVMFYDDVFTVNPRWLREFAPRYKREVGLPFWCYTYPTTTHREDILLLKDAGLKSITMGIQSGSPEMLDHFHRPVAQDKAIEAARIIVECGVECYFDLITKVHFEREEHLRQTFDFLVDFPREVRSVGFGAMVSFPEFGYTKRVVERGVELTVSDRDYLYYHKLYFLTRTPLPRPLVKAIGRSRLFRRFPRLLDALLPSQLPYHFLMDAGDAETTDVLNLPHAQAMLPAARGERGRPVEQPTMQ